MGTLLARRNRSDEAIVHFEKAIAIRPDSAESRNNLANVLARLNRLDQSIVEFEKALEISRRQAEPYLRACYNIAVSLQALDRHEEAIPHYRRAIAIDSDYAEAHNALGNALDEMQARAGSFSCTTKNSLQSGPTLAEAQNNLGVTLHALNREAEAIAHFTKAIAIKPDYRGRTWQSWTGTGIARSYQGGDTSLRNGHRACPDSCLVLPMVVSLHDGSRRRPICHGLDGIGGAHGFAAAAGTDRIAFCGRESLRRPKAI